MSDSQSDRTSAYGDADSPVADYVTAFPSVAKPVIEALRQLHDMVYFLDLQGRTVGFNPYSSELTGYSCDELSADRHALARLVHSGDASLALSLPDKGSLVTEFDYRLRHRDGSAIWMHSFRLAVNDESGNLCGYVCIDRDITAQKSAIEAVEAERDRAHEYLNIAGVILVALDSEGRVTMINRQGRETLGLPEADIVGASWFDRFVPEGDRDLTRGGFRAVMAGTLLPYERFENRVLCGDGRERLISWQNTIMRRPDGSIVGTLSSGEDITERIRAETMIRAREAELSSIFRAAPVGIGMSVDRTIKHVNQRLCDMLGYTREELIGQNSRFIYPNDSDFEYVGREKYRQIRETGTGTVETRWRRKDGRIIDILLSSSPFDQNDWAKGITFTALDITERKQAERALLEKNIAMREVLNQISADQEAIREQIATNIGEAILPMLNRLKERVDPAHGALVDQLRRDFEQISSPFMEILKNRQPRLTPRETEICNLIKNGLTSKEVAEMLSLSLGTVHKYRELIRRKLGLANVEVNLTSYLQSL